MTDQSSDAVARKEPATPDPSARPAFPFGHRVSVGLIAGLVVALLLAVFFLVQWRQASSAESQRNEVLAAAERLVPETRNLDYQTYDKDLERMIRNSTDDYRQALERVLKPQKPLFVRLQATLKVEASEIAIKSIRGNTAQVLLFVQETQDDKDRQAPSVTRSAVVMTLQKEDSRWLVAKATPL